VVRWLPDTYFAGQGTGHNSSKETKAGVGLQSGEDSIQHRSICDRVSCSSPFSRIRIQTCEELLALRHSWSMSPEINIYWNFTRPKKETFLCNSLVLCLIVTCEEGKMTRLEAGGWSLSYCAFEATRHYILTGRIVIETQVVLNKLCKKCICFIN